MTGMRWVDVHPSILHGIIWKRWIGRIDYYRWLIKYQINIFIYTSCFISHENPIVLFKSHTNSWLSWANYNSCKAEQFDSPVCQTYATDVAARGNGFLVSIQPKRSPWKDPPFSMGKSSGDTLWPSGKRLHEYGKPPFLSIVYGYIYRKRWKDPPCFWSILPR